MLGCELTQYAAFCIVMYNLIKIIIIMGLKSVLASKDVIGDPKLAAFA